MHVYTKESFQTHLKHTTCLFVDESRDSLDASTTCQASDSRLGDALQHVHSARWTVELSVANLDIITQHLAMALGTALAKTLATFAATGHGAFVVLCGEVLNVPSQFVNMSMSFVLCHGDARNRVWNDRAFALRCRVVGACV